MVECPMCGQSVKKLHLLICTACYERVVKALWSAEYDAMTVGQFKVAMSAAARELKKEES